jgi:hypothetical protein
MLLKKVDGLMYENDGLDLVYTPDVGDYVELTVFSCYLCIAWTVTKNQTFILLAVMFQNNKIVEDSDSPISPKNTKSAKGEVGARINGEVSFAQFFQPTCSPF